MSALFQTPKIPPPQALPSVPNTADAEVRKAADDRARLNQAQGRAANYLSNPNSGYTPSNKQEFLGGL